MLSKNIKCHTVCLSNDSIIAQMRVVSTIIVCVTSGVDRVLSPLLGNVTNRNDVAIVNQFMQLLRSKLFSLH